jgi:hypothetical protein
LKIENYKSQIEWTRNSNLQFSMVNLQFSISCLPMVHMMPLPRKPDRVHGCGQGHADHEPDQDAQEKGLAAPVEADASDAQQDQLAEPYEKDREDRPP